MPNKIVINIDPRDIKIECGQIFIKNGEPYMVSNVDIQSYSLICLKDGYRWRDSLSLKELQRIVIEDGFTPVGNVKITIEQIS